MEIISPNFVNGGEMPQKYSCESENINPEIVIENIPTETKSLVLIMDDPDAPRGIFNHWLIWNIGPNVNKIGEDSVPQNAVVGTNTAGKNKYSGPCPPSGTHRYIFKIFALDSEIDLAPTAEKGELEQAIKNHILEQAELIGLYTR
jgi:Raf kinase inhibitor-like YbhB/YbcL family protein